MIKNEPRIIDAEFEVITPNSRTDEEAVSAFFEVILYKILAFAFIAAGWLMFGPLYRFFKWAIAQL